MSRASGLCAVKDGMLAYELRGTGQPLVLIHGFSFDMRAWDAQLGAFADRHRVVRYDLRGFGRSSLPAGEYAHSDDLEALLTFLEIRNPILLGLSLGANVALDYSLTHPGQVRAQILASPGLIGYSWEGERPVEGAAARAARHGIDGAKDYWLNHALFAPLRSHSMAWNRVHAMVTDYSGWHFQHPNPVRMVKAAGRLADCRTPTLVVSGDRDITGYRTIAGILATSIPAASLLRFPDAGHVVNDEADPDFTAAILDFTANLEKSNL